jgi:hypothetical protein
MNRPLLDLLYDLLAAGVFLGSVVLFVTLAVSA